MLPVCVMWLVCVVNARPRMLCSSLSLRHEAKDSSVLVAKWPRHHLVSCLVFSPVGILSWNPRTVLREEN